MARASAAHCGHVGNSSEVCHSICAAGSSAPKRLRDEGFFCRRLIVEVKWLGRDRELWNNKCSFSETQDTGVLLRASEEIWREIPD